MDNKEKFYFDVKKFIDSELLREVYSNDRFSIMNISNYCYATFDYEMCSKTTNPFGVMMDSKMLKSIIENENKFYLLLNSMSDADIKDAMIFCDEKNFGKMIEIKQKMGMQGAEKAVDFEQKLFKSLKNKNR